MSLRFLREVKLYLMDVDGVICVAGNVVHSAPELIDLLTSLGKKVRFLTNDAVSSRQSRIKELVEQGLQIDIGDIYTASFLAAEYLRSFGNPQSLVLFSGKGIEEFDGLVINSEKPEYVVIGDFFGSYSKTKLQKAYNALVNGAKLVAMQKNRYWMNGNKPIIDNGFWVAGLEYCSGKQAEVIGKPSLKSYSIVLDSVGVSPHEAVMVSDDLYLDLDGAKKAGLYTIHVLSNTPPSSLSGTQPADLTVHTLKELAELVKSAFNS